MAHFWYYLLLSCFICIAFLGEGHLLHAQDQSTSFLDTWRAMSDDSTKIRELHKHLDNNYSYSGDSLYAIASEGLALASSLQDARGMILMHLYQGFGKIDGGKLQEASPYFASAKQISEQIKDTFLLARSITNQGLVQQDLGNEGKALTYYNQAASLFDKIGRPSASLFNNIAIIYRKQGNHPEAIESYKRSLILKEAKGDSVGVATTYMNLALLYSRESDSLATFQAAEQAIQMYKAIGYASHIAWASLAIGEIYADFGRTEEALLYLQDAHAYYEQHPENDYYFHALYTLGEMATRQSDWKQAVDYFSRALELAEQGQNIDERQTILKNLAEALNEQGNVQQAYPHLSEALRLKDTLTQRTRLALEEEMQARFELGQKESQVQIQQLELEQRKLNQKIAWGLLALSLVATLGVLYFLRQKNRATKLLQRQNQLIEKSLHEKEALMREIHHRVKNNLQFISSILRLQMRQMQDIEAKNFLRTSQNLVFSMALIHQHLYQGNQLRSIHIDTYLNRLISEITHAFQPVGVDLDIQVNIEPLVLDIDTAIPIGLIVNELISNSFKYAFQGRTHGYLSISLTEHLPHMHLVIEDDGPGLPLSSQMTDNTHFGFQLIQLLTEQLDGTLTLSNTQGASVSLQLPYKPVLR